MLVTKFVTHVRKFVIHVTNFVIKIICADSEKLLGARKKLLRGNKKTAQAANTVCAEGEDSLMDYFVRSILWSVRPSLSSI